MHKLFIESNYDSLLKYGEELCGDKVEIIETKDSQIIVLADGLGSGVKANILATLTSKIIATMISRGATVYEAYETVSDTLPVCQERQIAYSTFTILQIFKTGEAYLVQFDNPDAILIRDGELFELDRKLLLINGKKIYESRFEVTAGDLFVLLSDGVIHAGVGKTLDYGWQRENVVNYIKKIYKKENNPIETSRYITDICNLLYMSKPGDDTTIVAVKIQKEEDTTVMVGPPVNLNDDETIVKKLIESSGKKIVCGGTTSLIVSRITGKELEVEIDYEDSAIPPVGNIAGIDLVTEGIITLRSVLTIVKKYASKDLTMEDIKDLNRKDGASRLARLLIRDCTKINFIVGKAVNAAHQNLGLPVDLTMKLKIVEEIRQALTDIGKKVEIIYT